MDKRKIKLLPVEQLPQTIEISQISDCQKYEYAFSAKKHVLEKNSILVVTFFSLKDKIADFRVFFNKKIFAMEKLRPDRNWSNSTLRKLINIRCVETEKGWSYIIPAVCVNEKSAKLINEFFNQKDQPPIEVLYKFQDELRKRQLEAKHKKIRERTNSFMKQVNPLPKDIMKWANLEILPHYIYYKHKGKVIHGYCTACGSDVTMPDGRHNSKGECPNCKRQITFKAPGRAKRVQDDSAFSLVQKATNGLVVRFFTLDKVYGEIYKNPKLSYLEIERHFLTGDKDIKYLYDARRGDNPWYESQKSWIRDYFLYSKNLNEALKGTKWQYSALNEYVKADSLVNAVLYLQAYSEYPILEYLSKLKLYKLAEELVYRKYNTRIMVLKAIEVSGKRLNEALAVSKETLPLLQRLNVNSLELRFIQLIVSQYGYCTEEQLEHFRSIKKWDSYGMDHYLDNLAKIVKYTSYQKAVNYVAKQVPKDRDFTNTLSDWLDYLKHAKLLDYDITSDFILFPRNLKESHDRFAKEYSLKRVQINDEKIKSLSARLNAQYKFETENFLIRAPESAKEIKDEGAALKHCVGGFYIDEMAAGNIAILFIRKAAEPDKPFFTLEYKNGSVKQCRGNQNCDMTPEVKQFVAAWTQRKSKSRKAKSA